MADIALSILIAAQDNASKIITGLTGSFGPLGTAIAVASTAAVSFGVQSVQMAAQYQQSMNMIQSLTGSSNQQMAQYDSQIKALAVDTGVAATALSGGLYNVISAGYQGSDAMKMLTLSTKDSVIGMTDAATTSQALTNLIAGFSIKVQQADQVNGEMLRTVTLGKMTMEQYASSVSRGAEVSAQYKVSMEAMNASIATMTASGWPSAAQAVTGYSQLVEVMDGRTDTMAKRMEKLGISFDETKFKQMSFSQQLSYLNTILKGHSDQLQNIFVGSSHAARAFQTLTQHADVFAKDLKALSDQEANAKATQDAWAITQQGLNVSLGQLNAAVQNVMIELGNALVPTMTNVVKGVTGAITAFAQWESRTHTVENTLHTVGTAISAVVSVGAGIISFFQHNQIAMAALMIALGALRGALTLFVTAGLANAILSVLEFGVSLLTTASEAVESATIMTATFGEMAGMMIASMGTLSVSLLATLGPFMLIGAAVTAVGILIYLAVTHWGEITTWLQQQWQRFASWFMALWNSFAHLPAVAATIAFFQNAWNTISSTAQAAWGKVVSTWDTVKQRAQQTASNISTWFGQAWTAVSTQAQQTGSTLSQTFQSAWKAIQQAWQQSPLAGAFKAMLLVFSKLGPVIVQTLQQQFAPIGQAFAQIMPTLRTQLTAALSGIMPALTNLANSFKQQWQVIVTSAQVVGGAFKAAWQTVLPILVAVGQAISGAFMVAWKALAPALVQVGQALSGAFATAWKTLAPIFVQVAQTVSSALMTAWKALGPILAQVAQTVGGALATAWKVLQPILVQIGAMMGGQLLTALQAIGIVIGGVVLVAISLLLGAIVGIAKGIATFVQGLVTLITGITQIFSGIVQIASGFVALIVDLFTGNFTKLGTDLGVIWTGVQTLFTGVWNVIVGLFQMSIGTIVSFVQGFITTIVQFFTNLYNTLVGHSIIPEMLTAITAAFTAFFVTVLAAITTFITTIITFFTTLWTTLVNLYNTQLKLIETALSTAWTTISTDVQNAWNGIVNWLTTNATKIVDVIENPFKTAVSFVQGLLSNLQTSANNVLNNITGKTSGTSVPGHAAGGSNLPAGWSVIGEKGPELMYVPGGSTILPNSSYQALNTPSSSSGGIGGNVTITINAPQRTANEAKTIADAVSKELASRYRMQLGTIALGGSNI